MSSASQWSDLIVPNGGLDEVLQPQKVQDHKWTAALDVEALIDGVRRRPGSARVNAIPLQDIAEVYDTGANNLPFTDGSTEYHAQGFQSTTPLVVRQVAGAFTIDAGEPTGSIEVAIYTDSGGEPDAAVDGADFSNFSTLSASDLVMDSIGHWHQFTLSAPVVLAASTQYHLVFRHTAAVAGDTIDQWCNTSGGYTGGQLYESTDGSTWSGTAGTDLLFRVYSGEATIRAIADYSLSDGSATRHLVFAGDELYKNVSGVFTMVSDRKDFAFKYRHPSTGGTANSRSLPSWAIGNDVFYLACGGGFAWRYYIRNSVEYFDEVGLYAPTDSIVANDTGLPNPLPDGTYSVDYYFWNDVLGQPSNRRYQGSGAASCTCSSDAIVVTGLPTAPVDRGERATHIRLELLEPGSSIFRLVKEVALGPESGTHDGGDNEATVMTDSSKSWDTDYWVGCTITNVTDGSAGIVTANTATTVTVSALVGGTDNDWDDDDKYIIAVGSVTIDSTDLPTTTEAEYNHNKPPAHMVNCVAENRMFIGNIIDSTAPNGVGYSSRVMFSAINGIVPYYESIPTFNYRDFGLGDGDYLTALLFLPPRLMVVGMRNSLWAFDARQPKTSDKLRISETVGIAHHLSAVVHNGTLYFLSDSATERGFYRWRPGDAEPTRIRGADRSLDEMEVTQFKYSSMVVKPVDADRSQIVWTATTDQTPDGTQHDRLFVYDVALDALSVWSRPNTQRANVLGTYESSDVETVYLGGFRGVEYELDTDDEDDDGVGFVGSFSSKVFDGGAPFIVKRLKGIAVVYTADGQMDLSVERDYGDKSTHTDQIDEAASTQIAKTRGIRGAAHTFKATFSGEKPWKITGWGVNIQGTEQD